jgi:hypothetical protein
MAANIRVSSPAEDQPKAWTIVAVAAVGLACGLLLARWAGDGQRAVESEDETVGSESEALPTAIEPAVVDAGSAVDAAIVADASGRAIDEEELIEIAPEPIVVATPTPTRTPRVSATPSATITSIRHGRVAVLRCDGAPHQGGPFPCPRDEALEAIVWAAIDTLPACAAPPSAGEADLVVDFDRAAGSAAVLRARDTFRDDVVRADGEAVVACLAPTLATVATPITGERLMFSFRFVVQ